MSSSLWFYSALTNCNMCSTHSCELHAFVLGGTGKHNSMAQLTNINFYAQTQMLQHKTVLSLWVWKPEMRDMWRVVHLQVYRLTFYLIVLRGWGIFLAKWTCENDIGWRVLCSLELLPSTLNLQWSSTSTWSITMFNSSNRMASRRWCLLSQPPAGLDETVVAGRQRLLEESKKIHGAHWRTTVVHVASGRSQRTQCHILNHNATLGPILQVRNWDVHVSNRSLILLVCPVCRGVDCVRVCLAGLGWLRNTMLQTLEQLFNSIACIGAGGYSDRSG